MAPSLLPRLQPDVGASELVGAAGQPAAGPEVDLLFPGLCVGEVERIGDDVAAHLDATYAALLELGMSEGAADDLQLVGVESAGAQNTGLHVAEGHALRQ